VAVVPGGGGTAWRHRCIEDCFDFFVKLQKKKKKKKLIHAQPLDPSVPTHESPIRKGSTQIESEFLVLDRSICDPFKLNRFVSKSLNLHCFGGPHVLHNQNISEGSQLHFFQRFPNIKAALSVFGCHFNGFQKQNKQCSTR
jgi:hypothetical protein